MKPEEVNKILELFREFANALQKVFDSVRELLKPLTEVNRYNPQKFQRFDRVMSITPNKILIVDKRNRMYYRKRLS